MSDTIKIPKPDFSHVLAQPSGRVMHDELGNAIWKWSASGRATAENLVRAALTVGGDTGKYRTPREPDARRDGLPLGGGYDPYGSAPREQHLGRGPRDLRALSKAIEARRVAEEAVRSAAAHRQLQLAAARAGMSTGEYAALQLEPRSRAQA